MERTAKAKKIKYVMGLVKVRAGGKTVSKRSSRKRMVVWKDVTIRGVQLVMDRWRQKTEAKAGKKLRWCIIRCVYLRGLKRNPSERLLKNYTISLLFNSAPV